MLGRIFKAAVMVVMLSGPAFSQTINLLPGDKKLSPEDLERERAIERDYRNATSKIPDKKQANDPWGTVRTAPSQPAATAKQRQH